VFKNGQLHACIHWSEVGSVVAAKRDMMTYELVFLSLWSKGLAGKAVTIHELMTGFDALVATMHSTFPSIEPGWRKALESAPVFSEPERLLMVRDGSQLAQK
jgi:hypothetical protein